MPFKPTMWPEEAPPKKLEKCDKCELCHQRSRVIWGEGNPTAPLLVMLDNPGAREDREGQPYVCGTRETLQKAVYEVGLTMDDVYVTYILKCRPVRAYDKTAARRICLPHLKEQIQLKDPKLALCLGNVAVQAFFQNPELEVKNLRETWHEVEGLRVAVSYHPLAVRRRPNLYGIFLADWRMVAEELNGVLANGR